MCCESYCEVHLLSDLVSVRTPELDRDLLLLASIPYSLYSAVDLQVKRSKWATYCSYSK